MNSEDSRLARLLQAAHDDDRATPDFDRLLSRQRARRSRRIPHWLPLAAAAVLLAIAAAPLLEMRREQQALEFARELTAWRAPTDTLLSESYRSIDLFGELGGESVLGATHDMVRWRR